MDVGRSIFIDREVGDFHLRVYDIDNVPFSEVGISGDKRTEYPPEIDFIQSRKCEMLFRKYVGSAGFSNWLPWNIHTFEQINSDKLIEMYYIQNERPVSSYLRMLYFSSTTITTLGYGDIVPTSTASRMLTGFQSVLGIVLIGLSLNSIVRKSN